MLITDIQTFRKYAEVSNINFPSIVPTLTLVEQQHIIPFTGQALYDVLDALVNEEGGEPGGEESEPSALQTILIENCRRILGPMVCYYYTPLAEVKLSDSGAHRLETNNAKTAFQNQVVNFREQNRQVAEMNIEQLLKTLENNKATLSDWTDSDEYKEYSSLFIKTGGEFQKLFTTAAPYRNYWAMRSFMKDVEENSIRNMLSDTLFASLKQITTPSETESQLLYKLRKLIAYETVEKSIPFLNVDISGHGITVMGTQTVQNDKLAKSQSASTALLEDLIRRCDAAAKSWQKNVINHLNTNADDFAGWELPDDSDDDDQENLSGVFGLI